MPPHCDSVKGPVVTAAKKALDADRVELVLPYVKKEGEAEIRGAFALVAKARTAGPEAKDVADRYFFDTVVRVHRAGEGAPFTGVKADADEGPVIPIAERAIERRDATELIEFLTTALRDAATRRFTDMLALERVTDGDVAKMREYVEAALGVQVWSHKVYECIGASPHAGAHHHGGA